MQSVWKMTKSLQSRRKRNAWWPHDAAVVDIPAQSEWRHRASNKQRIH
jgi:hypothetical protein